VNVRRTLPLLQSGAQALLPVQRQLHAQLTRLGRSPS
jgi:hypothetical protein